MLSRLNKAGDRLFTVVPRRFNSIIQLMSSIEQHSRYHNVTKVLFCIEKVNSRGATSKDSSLIIKASNDIQITMANIARAYINQVGKFIGEIDRKLSRASYCLSYQISYEDESIEFYQVYYINEAALRADKANLIRSLGVNRAIADMNMSNKVRKQQRPHKRAKR